MQLTGTARINNQGELEIGGVTASELVARFGTPLYVMDEELIRENCRAWRAAVKTHLSRADVVYAAKAFCTLAMCRLVEQEGLGLDVVSGGELYTASSAGFPAGRIYFNGNNKSREELELAVNHRVGRIIVDNFLELELLEDIAASQQREMNILLRVSPGIEAHTHEYVKTGQLDSKFGFTLENGQAMTAVRKALRQPYLKLRGVQCHIGSQIFALDGYREATRVLIRFLRDVKQETGALLDELDLGGGLGVYYSEGDTPVSVAQCVGAIAGEARTYVEEMGIPLPKLVFEPGRSIVGPAGTVLYRVGARKEIPGVRTYVAVDGGMADNPRPALYGSRYSALVANKANKPSNEQVTIAGKCCESGDILIQDINLPHLEAGDILAVFTAGAYQYSMASNYNRLARPAVVFVRAGEAYLVVKRESMADLVRNDIIPAEWTGNESLRVVR
ncbi:MAG: diaminopimelate decarboxylase [Firmicutes bacterium]|jgi:diaminopimelate decarboxylase|nr:diaminopimelate decarboxylase [Bacillota bacterium]